MQTQKIDIQSIHHLEYVLRASQKEIESVISDINKFYREMVVFKLDEHGKPKLDKNGNPKKRVLHPSSGKLKKIQARIKVAILEKMKMPKCVRGGVKGKDNVRNAKEHQGNKFKFATDLKDFFPSVNHHQVFQMFLENNFSPTISRLLTQLTTYKGCLPQGAPTSTHVANLVFAKVDARVQAFCDVAMIKYTRFVDDLSFSSSCDFQKESLEILQIIQKHGFRISYKKTFYTSGKAEFTGIVVGQNGIDVNKAFKSKLQKTLLWPDASKTGLMKYYERVKKISKLKTKKIYPNP